VRWGARLYPDHLGLSPPFDRIVIADLMIFVLRSATGGAPDGSELEALDDIFMGLICEAKDGIVACMALLTSLINCRHG